MKENVLDISKGLSGFRDKALRFIVSSRFVQPFFDIADYLKVYYIYCDMEQIDSVFGFTSEFVPLYGGRVYRKENTLTEAHLENLYENKIGLSLTLTNHFFNQDLYEKSLHLLKRNHREGNSIICVNDDLAMRIKRDFPLYTIKASMIKRLDTQKKVEKALRIYDSITIPMEMNDNDAFLEKLPEKKRIILFGNAGCAYKCQGRSCYLFFSKYNMGAKSQFHCSRGNDPLKTQHVFFDVEKFANMGFRQIKLIPIKKRGIDGIVMNFANKKNYFLKTIKKKKPVYYFCSFPKSGRTWIRYILAHYLNKKYNLGMNIQTRSIFKVSPNVQLDRVKGLNGYAFAEDRRFPLLLFSHDRYSTEVFNNNKIVFMFRKIPDILVSLYFHEFFSMKKVKGTLKEFIRNKEGGTVRFCSYMNSWCQVLNKDENKLLISYENLYDKPYVCIERVLSFLEIPVDIYLLEQSVKESSFKVMSEMEMKYGVPGLKDDGHNRDARRIRKGKINGYKDYLNEEDVGVIMEILDERLNDEAKFFLNSNILYPIK